MYSIHLSFEVRLKKKCGNGLKYHNTRKRICKIVIYKKIIEASHTVDIFTQIGVNTFTHLIEPSIPKKLLRKLFIFELLQFWFGTFKSSSFKLDIKIN